MVDETEIVEEAEEVEGGMPKYKGHPRLRLLEDSRKSVQKLRIEMRNRVFAYNEGEDQQTQLAENVLTLISDTTERLERDLDRIIEKEIKGYEIYNYWLGHVRGIGPSFAAQLISYLFPPTPEKGPSAWYAACGLYPQWHPDEEHPRGGEYHLPRPRAGGGKITYHPRMRVMMYNVCTSFVRQKPENSFYRRMYEQYKADLIRKHKTDEMTPELVWPAWRIESVARVKTIKLFLSHLWDAWSNMLGFEPRPPYIVEKEPGVHLFIPRPIPENGDKV